MRCRTLGERESGTARLEAAVAACRAALEEYTRDRVPFQWAETESNLGKALEALGERENRIALLEDAVTAYRAALEEYTRDRVPFRWAETESNLGDALEALGERESGTARLTEAVAAYRTALEERARERGPVQWATSFGDQGVAMMVIADRTNDAPALNLRWRRSRRPTKRNARQGVFSDATDQSQDHPRPARRAERRMQHGQLRSRSGRRGEEAVEQSLAPGNSEGSSSHKL